MLNFSTEIPVDPKNSIADVLTLAIEWVAGSPHANISAESFRGFQPDAENRYTFDAEGATIEVTLIHTEVDHVEIGALKHVRLEASGLQWTSTMVATKSETSLIVGFQVVCEAMNTAVHLPPPKKPYFIRQTIERLGGGMDGEIPVADEPFVLSPGEERIAAALINGTAKNRLPIVYVSAGFDGSYVVNPASLSRLVSGTAHVVVEPNRDFSIRLKQLVSGRNVFGGTVAVYWPESMARRAYYRSELMQTAKSIEVKIASDIRLALSNRRARSSCTWSFVTEILARKRLDELRAKGSTELSEYIKVFDADQRAKDQRIEEYEVEIARLNAEVTRLSFSQGVQGEGILNRGKEQDFYQGEISDVAIDAIQQALKAAMHGSRRSHILADLLAANFRIGKGDQNRDQIKNLLNSYTEMDARTRAGLLSLGFQITDDGKHYKAVYQGDGRYTFALSKTGSDHRGGKNTASDINRTLF